MAQRPQSETESVADRVLREHRKIHALAAQIGNARQPGNLLAPLVDLLPLLQRHFAAEEGSNGFYEYLADRAPRLRNRMVEVVAEHVGLLASFRELQQRAKANPSPTACDEARTLVARLRAHEKAEDDLLIEALDHDVGGQG